MSVSVTHTSNRTVKENRSMTRVPTFQQPTFVTDRDAYGASLRSGPTFSQISSGLSGGATRILGKQY